MGELVFVGLGLQDHRGISLQGLEEARTADKIFIELYTNLLPSLSLDCLEDLAQKKIQVLRRKDLEEDNGEKVLTAARNGKAVLFVPGDPLIATTHVSLRVEARKQQMKTRIVHGSSILSAAIGLSGLHSYKFGKSVTVPFPDDNPSTTPYSVIAQNKRRGLHTLCLLDIKAEEKQYLSINDALRELLKIETNRECGVVTPSSVAVGVARAGDDDPTVKAGYVKDLANWNFRGPPHTLILTGRLHFTEAEALVALADAPATIGSQIA